MSVEADLLEAQQAIGAIFSLMAIKCIICVDDEYAKKYDLEPIIAICSTLDSDKLGTIDILTKIATEIDNDPDIFNDSLKKLWESIEIVEQQKLQKALIELSEDAEVSPPTNVHLSNILSEHDLKELSLTEWKAQKEDFLKLSGNSKCLILFDQDMSNEGEGRIDEGILQIKDIIEQDNNNVYLGVLSNTFSINDEIDKWLALAKEYEIPHDRFVFVAKDRLHKPISFARMIKLTTIAPECKKLKDRTKRIYKEALKAASDEIDQINIYDFEHIVFHHSYDEGIWEPETLFRMYSHYHKRKIVEESKTDIKIEESTDKIRKVSHLIPPGKDTEKPAHRSWQYQRSEHYADQEFINSHHLPLELGDIFEQTTHTGKNTFILLGQPCDIMVRKKGTRSLQYCTMASIEEIEKTNNPVDFQSPGEAEKAYLDLASDSKKLPFRFELEYLREDLNKISYVCFNRTFSLDIIILDLCVFCALGHSTFNIDEGCPTGLIPSWKNLHKKICKTIKTKLSRHHKIKKALGTRVSQLDIKEVLKGLLFHTNLPNSFSGTVNNAQLAYPIKRVGRVNKAKAEVILSQYTNYLARIGFERDVGKEL